jgi:hypothetical protein
MSADLERALQELYQAPLDRFVAERKRIAEELRGNGDAAAAKDVEKRRRPPISVWAVNQLYGHDRADLDALFSIAAKLRKGDRGVSKDYHAKIAQLRKRAGALLQAGGHAATDATLRRVATTLAALAAAGGFEPDPPGALTADRDPPGFEAVGAASGRPKQDQARDEAPARGRGNPALGKRSDVADLSARRAAAERERREAAAERERRDAEAAEAKERAARQAERKRRESERDRVRAALKEATADLRTKERAKAQLEKELAAADKATAQAKERVETLEERLARLLEGK